MNIAEEALEAYKGKDFNFRWNIKKDTESIDSAMEYDQHSQEGSINLRSKTQGI